MNKREMKNYCRQYNCIWSTNELARRVDELGYTVKRFDFVMENETPLFYDRVNRKYLNMNLLPVVFHEGSWITEEEYDQTVRIALTPAEPVHEPVLEYFTQDELRRISDMEANLGSINRFYSYGQGDFIYESLGVFSDGADDHSPTVGFELETNMDIGFTRNTDLIARNYLDKRLGHIESDGSINGVEFNSHVFTWNKLKKIRPVVESQLMAFSNAGLAATQGAGLHIHIGREFFSSEQALQKFYYLINLEDARQFWTRIARRVSDYATYRQIRNGDVNHTINSMNQHRGDHGVAVNQQHANTIEVRIFQSTLSADVLYACIEVLMNLLSYVNNDSKMTISTTELMTGEYATKYSGTMGSINYRVFDVSAFMPLSSDRLMEMVNDALTRMDTASAVSLIQRYEQQQNRRPRRAN